MPTVTVYSKPRCIQCDATYRCLDRLGVPYVSVDVTRNRRAHAKIVGLGYASAPVVVAGKRHWSGFRPDLIATLV